MNGNKKISRREFLTTNAVMGFMLSEAWRQPEGSWLDKSESMQDPADILEKTQNKLNDNYEDIIV